jgi:UDP-N-acetylmuramoyl-L-alanyl-D-glutamate--2,6-diaminopimelate ligase
VTIQPITLKQIAEVIDAKLTGDHNIPVVDISHDSRRVGPGVVFVAVRGSLIDAQQLVPEVMAAGAVAVISEQERPQGFQGSWLEVENVRRAMAHAAAEVHHHPSRELQLVGITGTHGKTTTAHLIASVPEAAHEPVAMIGSVEYRIGADRRNAERTTPEATDTQRLLRKAVVAGCRTAVMECSSEGMDLHRCDALSYAVAVFTNLTRDRLYYHKTMENYWHAKQRLFDGRLGTRPQASVINVDDPHGAELADRLEGDEIRVIRYALEAKADVTAWRPNFSLNGMDFHLVTPKGEMDFHSPLVGFPNVYSTLAAVGAALALGYEFDLITRALAACTGAPGRFERVSFQTLEFPPDFAVIVDYAHTDDAMLRALRTAQAVKKGRIITVFGCGGDRDRTKRAPMGETAGRLSDLVILTSDNPRTEFPGIIMADAEEGLLRTGKPYRKIGERREAIRQAVSEARTDDLVVIAGKGHENYQIIGRETFYFNDKEVAVEEVSAITSSLDASLRRQKLLFQETTLSGERQKPLQVFLCHASDDKPIVRDLHKRLISEGFDSWFDEESLVGGSDWALEIEQKVRAVDTVLVCLSQHSIKKKGFVQKEMKAALDVANQYPEGTIFLIPLRLEECEVPYSLKRFHRIDLFGERGYERLIKALRHRAQQQFS